MNLIETFDKIYRKYGQRFYGGDLHNHNPHCLVVLVGARIKQGDAAHNKQARDMVRELIVEGGKHGYGEYRTPIVFMDEAAQAYDFNDNALLRMNERIKDSLDPNGILAPGKNGIWPAHLRDNKR